MKPSLFNRFLCWVRHPAPWYAFWYPSSGFLGGVLLSAVIYASLFFLLNAGEILLFLAYLFNYA